MNAPDDMPEIELSPIAALYDFRTGPSARQTALCPVASTIAAANAIGCRRHGFENLGSLVGAWISTQGDCVACRTMALQFLERQADLEDLDRVEVEFRVQAALDSCGLAKAALFAGKHQITNWFGPISQSR